MRRRDVLAGRFELEEHAGAGGMGAVWRAHDRETGQTVAVKILHAAGDDGERFAREARALASLRHRGIVRHVAHGVAESGEPFLAMEWLEGEDLAERLERGPLPPAEAVAIVADAARALGAAHRRAIVHRDVKPSNLFLVGGRATDVRLLDFGVAHLGRATRPLTRSGAMLGTPGYMAPEHIEGLRAIDARADVFALGCVLYEAIAGRPAFVAEHPVALLAKVLLDAPPSLRKIRGVQPELAALVDRLLAKSPAARPADGDAAADALEALGAIDTIELDGEPPAAPARAEALTTDEQQLVSVVMSFGRSGAGDAGTAPTLASGGGRDTLSDAEHALRAEADALGARLVALPNGARVAFFAGSGAATDQAARAARCALAWRARDPAAPAALCTGRARVEEHLPVGEALDRAAALLRRGAPPGALLLDELSAGLLDGSYEVAVGPAGLELRGRRALPGEGRRLLGRPTPCVGRERDLETLGDLFRECVAEPVARAVVVTGPPGMGKSRLRHELERALAVDGAGLRTWVARGDALARNTPLALAADAVARQAHLAEGDAPEARRQKIRACAARAFAGADLERVAAFLGELTGAPFDDGSDDALRTARRVPRLMADQIDAAFLDLLAADCAGAPVLFVLDDLQWSDGASVELLGDALRRLRERPFLLLALGRPEVDDVFPGLWRAHGPQRLSLQPLGRRAAEKLARAVLGDVVPADTIGRVVERAAGNPFFLEELLRAAAAGRGDEAPGTVLAMLQARLGELEEGARRALRAAAVFGASFTAGGMTALLGGEGATERVAAELDGLVENELVERRQGTADGWTFRHALVRDAALAMLTEEDRVRGHRLAAEWLERAGDASPAAMAEHWELGEAPERAVPWLVRAAEDAHRRYDARAATSYAERAIGAGATGEARGAALSIIGAAHAWRAEYGVALGYLEEAQALLPRGSPGWYQVVERVMTANNNLDRGQVTVRIAAGLRAPDLEEAARTSGAAESGVRLARASALAHAAQVLTWLPGQEDESRAFLEEAMQVAGQTPDPFVLASVESVRGTTALWHEDLATGLRHTLEAVRWFEHVGNRRNASAQMVNASHAMVGLGLYEEGERTARRAHAIARALESSRPTVTALQNLAQALAGRGALAEATAVAEESAELAGRGDAAKGVAGARALLAQLRLAGGDLDGAEADARATLAAGAVPILRPAVLTTLGMVLLARGRAAEAVAVFEEAMALPGTLGRMGGVEGRLRLAHAEALDASGRGAEARSAVAAARDRLVALAGKIDDAAWRESFLRRVPENARTFALAEAWGV